MNPLTAQAFVEQVQGALLPLADAENAAAMAQYMQNHFAFLGVKTPERTAATGLLVRQLAPGQVLPAAQLLWDLPEREFQYVAVQALIRQVNILQPDALSGICQLIESKSWWDTVDLLASRVVGGMVRQHPELVKVMDAWSQDSNLWLRRTALLHQLGFRKNTDQERLFRYCLHNASSPEFFIRKAIGWALREHAKTAPRQVLQFVEDHVGVLSALSRREALKHLG